METDRKSKRGPKPIDAAEKRNHTVSSRLNADELSRLDAQRGKFLRGEWMRMAALDQLPPSIPAINLDSYNELARVGANLNQLSKRANATDQLEISELSEILAELRHSLLGARR